MTGFGVVRGFGADGSWRTGFRRRRRLRLTGTPKTSIAPPVKNSAASRATPRRRASSGLITCPLWPPKPFCLIPRSNGDARPYRSSPLRG